MTTTHNIHNNILEKIQAGTIHQKPRWYFVLMTLSIVLGLVALFLILFYLVSFVALVLREHLLFEALSFGPRTVFAIMHKLPLLLIFLVVAVFVLLHLLVRHFAFAYMKPVMMTLGVGLLLTLVTFAGVLFLDKESRIARFGEGQHVPGFRLFHEQFRDRMPLVLIHGTITRADADGYGITDRNKRETYVRVTADTRSGQTSFAIGDYVAIFAENRQDGLYALGIRKDNDDLPRPVGQ